jgi:predicted RNA-binding protein YlxR (DUF448 family)
MTRADQNEQRTAGTRPERTCVACRRRAPSAELFRVASTPDSTVVIDWRRNLGGRGAYVCAARACIDRAVRRRLFDRTLKRRVSYPVASELIDMARAAQQRRCGTLIATALGTTDCRPGVEAALSALDAGRARYLLIARDSASRDQLLAQARERSVPLDEIESKATLGALARCRETGALAITDDGLGAAIRAAQERLTALS